MFSPEILSTVAFLIACVAVYSRNGRPDPDIGGKNIIEGEYTKVESPEDD